MLEDVNAPNTGGQKVVIRLDGRNISGPIARDFVMLELQKLDEDMRARVEIIPVTESGAEILLG